MAKTNDNKFYGQRPPSSHSNALSEIEMNHDGMKGPMAGGGFMARRNNLMSGDNQDDLNST